MCICMYVCMYVCMSVCVCLMYDCMLSWLLICCFTLYASIVVDAQYEGCCWETVLQIIQMTSPNTWPKHIGWLIFTSITNSLPVYQRLMCRTRSYVRCVFSPTKCESLPAPNRLPDSVAKTGFPNSGSFSSTVPCGNGSKPIIAIFH